MHGQSPRVLTVGAAESAPYPCRDDPPRVLRADERERRPAGRALRPELGPARGRGARRARRREPGRRRVVPPLLARGGGLRLRARADDGPPRARATRGLRRAQPERREDEPCGVALRALRVPPGRGKRRRADDGREARIAGWTVTSPSSAEAPAGTLRRSAQRSSARRRSASRRSP